MKDPRPQPIFRKDYRPPDYWIDTVDLDFDLGDETTRVTSKLSVRRNEDAGSGPKPLVLHGEKLQLVEVQVDGRVLESSEYRVDETTLQIASVPARFELTTVVEIEPQNNTELEGLYRSSGTFCTQCEAEGFRKITYFLDRPDVMARYRAKITADKKSCPVLLSNGNRIETGELEDGRHFVRWEDPFPKPSYLFALVAGDLQAHTGTFTTRSGREVKLEIWVEPRNVDACEHALRSLQHSMKWDEEVFGLEYDLDIYMIVAVGDFNMGAMENKGLNVFNAKYVLARPETATDADYQAIEGVIGHEYFHNWTGNRVTCRDWFQLTLKEGLTVFRDEQFTADMNSAAVKRIEDVRLLRMSQFAEDRSPTAHPIRPDSYIEMNNFYTVTVYNKGAEVIRMIHTLLGPEGFRKGMDLYFERHDGQAVTCDDFRGAMADANGVDLEQFGRWYSQVGTPVLEASHAYREADQIYELTLQQRSPPNVDAKKFRPLHIPVTVGLIAPDGSDMTPQIEGSRVAGTTALLELKESRQTFRFTGVSQAPIVSVGRGFSAPVNVEIERSQDELAFLMAHDSDSFNRWDAAQSLGSKLLLALAKRRDQDLSLDPKFVEAFGRVLSAPDLDGSLKALTLVLPAERLLGQQQDVVDPDRLHEVRRFARRELARAHRDTFASTYESLTAEGPYSVEQADIDGRALRNLCLHYLVATGDDSEIERARAQFHAANNMTDAQAAVTALADTDHDARAEVLTAFYDRWKDQPLVIDKWFSIQATSSLPDAFERVVKLAEHPDFTLKNPNRARSLLGAFAVRNQVRFHAADGRGYEFVGDKILELDAITPQVAARLVGAFNQWRRFDEDRQAKMKATLTKIVQHKGVSKDVYELATKCLG